MTDPADDLRDLDDPESPRARALVADGNAEVARRLRDETFEADRARLRAVIEDEDKLFAPRRRGAHQYDFHRNAQHPRGLWRRIPEGVPPAPDAPWEPVFDLDAHCAETGKEWAWRGPTDRPEGGRVLLGFSDDGADVGVAREFDLDAKGFVDGGFETPPCRQNVMWDGPDALLLCAATGEGHATRSGWPRTVRLWPRGTAPDEAPVVHEAAREDVLAFAWREPGGPRVFATAHTTRASTLAVEADGRRVVPDLPREADKWTNGRVVAWVPQEDGPHPAGCLVLRGLDGSPGERVLVAPGERGAVEDVLLSRDWLVAVGHEELVPWLRVLDLRQPDAPLRDVPLPPGATAVGAWWHAAVPDGADADRRLDVSAQGMLLPPTLLRLDLDAGPDAALEEVARAKPSFDAAGMTARLLEVASEDGTRVPYHLALPREAAGGPVPVVVTAYGGYGIPVHAHYQRLMGPALLERGIGLAVAHIRGGGEFGPRWHLSAIRDKRPRSFEDCAAVARDLVGRGVAPPGGVGFVGGSNGGLLACVMLTRFPGDFGAIKAEVPVTDMLRFHRYEAGAAWIDEYGDPDDPADAAFLRAYSPVHTVRPAGEARYPPVLLDAPAHDDRVDPAHARRLAHRLREAGQDVLLRTAGTGGHGGGETSERAAEDAAATAAFFRLALGGGLPGPRPPGDASGGAP